VVIVVADQWITSSGKRDDEVVVAELAIEPVDEPINFLAYVKDFTWNSRDGELNIKLAAPMAEKVRAMRITDYPGMMLDISATVVTFDEEDEDGD